MVWSTKYRYKVLQGDIRLRVRAILRQVCSQKGVDIITGVLSADHVHMFVSIPPKLAVCDLMRLENITILVMNRFQIAEFQVQDEMLHMSVK